MEKKPPIPEDMVKCLSGYFVSKEFEDDLSALFEEVQQSEYSTNPDRAKAHAEVSQPHSEMASVVQFFMNAIEDTDECKDIISKISREQVETAIRRELEDIRKGTVPKYENELNKKEIVEVFRRMIQKEFDHINKEYFPDQMAASVSGAPLPTEPEKSSAAAEAKIDAGDKGSSVAVPATVVAPAEPAPAKTEEKKEAEMVVVPKDEAKPSEQQPLLEKTEPGEQKPVPAVAEPEKPQDAPAVAVAEPEKKDEEKSKEDAPAEKSEKKAEEAPAGQ